MAICPVGKSKIDTQQLLELWVVTDYFCEIMHELGVLTC